MLVLAVTTGMAAGANVSDQYTIQPGDTLWKIAERYLPDGTKTTYEKMQILFQANPEAFINHDINRLRTGHQLHMPTPEATHLDPVPTKTVDVLDPASSRAPSGPPSQVAETDPGFVTDDRSQPQHGLTTGQEHTTRQRVENEALRARIAALEAKIKNLDSVTSEPAPTRHDDLKSQRPRSPSETITRFTVPLAMWIASGFTVLSLAGIWRWRRRATAHEAMGISQQIDPQPSPDHATLAPPTPGLGDLTAATRPAGETKETTTAQADTESRAEVSSDIAFSHLMIDLDDLDLEPSQVGSPLSRLPKTASISPKIDPASPSNAR
jgi:FimV-like protein